MIRNFLRNVGRLLVAPLALTLILCAVETGLRVESSLHPRPAPQSNSLSVIVRPSETSYREIVPLLDTESSPEQPGLQTSEWGTRGPSPESPKPAGTVRVLCLGGEETFAAQLAEEATFCHALEELLQQRTGQKVEVINAGCPQSGPLGNLLRLRMLVALQPDIVIFTLQAGELGYDAPVRASLRLDESGFPAFSPNPAIAGGSHPLVRLRRDFATVDLIATALLPTIAPESFSPESRTGDELLPQTLSQLQALAKSHLANCEIVLLPDVWDLEPSRQDQRDQAAQELRDRISPAVEKGELNVVDALPLYRNQPDLRKLFSRQGTLNADGQRLYAEFLAQTLTRQFPSLLSLAETHTRPN